MTVCFSNFNFFSDRTQELYFTAFRIGDCAKNAFQSNHKNTVFDVKRLIGRTMEEPKFMHDLKHLPFTI
jgi:molecular chaperone DnaK (HSP70)